MGGMASQQQQLVRKLRGHSKSVLCCVAGRDSSHLLFSSSEDGSVCIFDIRSKCFSQRLESFGGEAVVSVCLCSGDVEVLYAAAGTSVYTFDLRLGSSGRELQRYSFNKDEVNQVVVDSKATFMAAADDTGEIKVIDLASHRVYKTLRGGHTNICSTVQFHPQRPWEVLSGGLDSRILKWDFSRGRPLKEINLALSTQATLQICNPPFIHSLAVADGQVPGESGRLMVAARGDGAVDVFDVGLKDPVLPEARSMKKKTRHNSGQGKKHTIVTAPNDADFRYEVPGRLCHLALDAGGHTCAVSNVSFARFGSHAQYIVSGGSDSLIKLWDWTKQRRQDDPAMDETTAGNPLILTIQHKNKINWCTTTQGSIENLIVADTSKVLSVYTIS